MACRNLSVPAPPDILLNEPGVIDSNPPVAITRPDSNPIFEIPSKKPAEQSNPENVALEYSIPSPINISTNSLAELYDSEQSGII